MYQYRLVQALVFFPGPSLSSVYNGYMGSSLPSTVFGLKHYLYIIMVRWSRVTYRSIFFFCLQLSVCLDIFFCACVGADCWSLLVFVGRN